MVFDVYLVILDREQTETSGVLSEDFLNLFSFNSFVQLLNFNILDGQLGHLSSSFESSGHVSERQTDR